MEVGVCLLCMGGRGSLFAKTTIVLICEIRDRLLAADIHDVLVKQASTSGNVGVINLLLKKGADVSVTDKDGVTTLMSAASHGHAQVGATPILRSFRAAFEALFDAVGVCMLRAHLAVKRPAARRVVWSPGERNRVALKARIRQSLGRSWK